MKKDTYKDIYPEFPVYNDVYTESRPSPPTVPAPTNSNTPAQTIDAIRLEPDGSITYESDGIKFNAPKAYFDFETQPIAAKPVGATVQQPEMSVPTTAKSIEVDEIDELVKHLINKVNMHKQPKAEPSAGSDMGFSKTTNELGNSVIDRLGQIDKKLSEIDIKLNQASKQAVHSHNAPVRLVFDAQDLEELEALLDKMEQASASFPKTDHFSDFPVPPKAKINNSDSIKPKIDPNTISEFFEDLKIEHLDGEPKGYVERDHTMAHNKVGWITEPDGTRKHYTKDGVLHCDTGPAEIRTNGTQLYYRNGNLHRDGGLPAMVGARGTEKYAVNGQYHRLGGLPAITWSKGPFRFEYWINGQIYSAQRKDGTVEYYAPGCIERDQAILSRMDGPAVVHPNGKEEFWIKGKQYSNRSTWLAALEHYNNVNRLNNDMQDMIDEDPIEEADTTPEVTASKVTTRKTSKEKTMTKPSFTDQLKANAVSAGYRVAGTQLTTLVKNSILTVMRNKGADGGAIQAFAAFLDTEFGNAMISFAIGSGLNYVPHFSDDPRVQRLAEEMSVAGMATAGNAVIGEAMQHVLPAVSQILQNLPNTESSTNNVRVVETNENSKLAEALEEEEVDAEETETVPAKTMKA